MHTDEYEISLSREMAVCSKKVNALRKKLFCFEERFNMSTEDFIAKFRHSGLDTHNSDFISWLNYSEALVKWQDSLRQYRELFFSMKN